MKKNITHYMVLSSLFIFGNIFSQNTENEESIIPEIHERFITIAQLENNLTKTKKGATFSETNTVFIQQIGYNNSIFSTINARSSDINIRQDGKQNIIDINETSRDIEKIITQTGDYNTVTDFSFNPEISTHLELVQEGNNLYFERLGSNELSKNLQFKMTGNNRSIIIRSF